MKYSLSSLIKFSLLPVAGLVVVVVYGGVSPTPAHACGAPTATQLFCGGTNSPPGFGSTFQDNLTDPLGGQCTAGGPGCTNDTFVNPGIGDCTDGSTGCNAGAGTALPVSNDPCISCFADPGEVGSLAGGEDDSLQPARDYLSTQRQNLEEQRKRLEQSESTAENAQKGLDQNSDALRESRTRLKTLEQRYKKLPGDTPEEEFEALEKEIDAEKAKVDRLRAEEGRLLNTRNLAQQNAVVQGEIVESLEGKIEEVERTGNVPQAPGGLLTQFGGGGEATQAEYRYKGGENSSYNKALEGGKGYTFENEQVRAWRVDGLFDGAVGSQFIRSTSGHATTGDNLSAGTIAGAEAWDKPFLIVYQFMRAGLNRKLADAIRRGEVAGTIEIVKDKDGSTKEIVTVSPEGLEAAKPYLDAADSLFEGMIEEDANTTSDEERIREQDERERDEREYQRQAQKRELERQKRQRANPVPAQDVKDNTDPNGIIDVLDVIGVIIPLT